MHLHHGVVLVCNQESDDDVRKKIRKRGCMTSSQKARISEMGNISFVYFKVPFGHSGPTFTIKDERHSDFATATSSINKRGSAHNLSVTADCASIHITYQEQLRHCTSKNTLTADYGFVGAFRAEGPMSPARNSVSNRTAVRSKSP